MTDKAKPSLPNSRDFAINKMHNAVGLFTHSVLSEEQEMTSAAKKHLLDTIHALHPDKESKPVINNVQLH